jgi:probable rRNA maturation factor
MEIDVLIEHHLEETIDLSWFRAVAERTLAIQYAQPNTEVGLVITGDEKVKELNKTYRGKDETTDVLAFYMTPGTNWLKSDKKDTFATPPDDILHLGEVVISYPKAVKQADEHNHSVKKELTTLIIHGILHLMGYDHQKDVDEKKMKAREEEIIGDLGDLF